MRFMMLMIPKGYETAEPGTVPDAKAVGRAPARKRLRAEHQSDNGDLHRCFMV
jgi:hypothetical protein